jgi:hypothetical protein
MKKNIGTVDRALRICGATLLVLLVITKVISGILAIILLVVAVMFIVTSFISVCPLYPFLGINTRKKV